MSGSSPIHARAEAIFSAGLLRAQGRNDRLVFWLLVLHWPAAVLLAWLYSPLTWIGAEPAPHRHLLAALFLGAVISAYPCQQLRRHPGSLRARLLGAGALASWSALLIHLSGGRIETHFHVFVILPCLALYRDYRVLFLATAVVAVDHALRGIWWPLSVFGTSTESPWRWAEHAAWVLGAVAFLSIGVRQGLRHLWQLALGQAVIEAEGADQLRRSEGVTRSFYEAAPLLMGVVELRGDDLLHISDNPATEAFFGVEPGALQGKLASELGVDTGYLNLWLEHYRASAARGRPVHFEYCHGQADQGVWLHVHVSALEPEAGCAPRFCYVAQDVSDRKRAELELARSQQEAVRANRAKTEFLANMSHEIRTPMNAIIGFSEILSEKDLPDEQREEGAAIVRRNGEYLVNLINDILDISKLEAEQIRIEPSPTDVAALCRETLALLRPLAEQRGIELAARFTAELPAQLEVDPTRLRQILDNLLRNAIKFNEAGSARLEVSYHDGQLACQIDDDGIGIPLDKQQVIFEPFAQADSSSTRRFGGTGLGLSICRRLVELMHGSLELHSHPGEGTSVDLRIPTKIPAAPAQAHPVRQASSEAPQLEGLRVLYAEDGPDNRRLIQHLLKKAGVALEMVENGALAVEAVQRDPGIDLVLMDMQMPVMDGYTATTELRRQGCEVPIVALTAHALDHDRQRCLDAGCDAFETKPVRRVSLLQTIARLTRPS